MPDRKPYFGARGGGSGRKPYLAPARGAKKRTPYFGHSDEPAKTKPEHYSFFGLEKNVASDLVHTIAGLPSGIVQTARHPKQAVKAVGQSYKETYGPLAHGDVSRFLHNFYEHPLGPLLDVASVATVGAATAVKGGSALAKAGVISEDSRLAQLGRVERLQHVGPNGRIVEGKVLHRNPLIRSRQKLTHATLARIGEHLPFLGETRRFAREIAHLPRQDALRARLAMRDYSHAFRKLSLEEQAALHLIGRGVSPEHYLAYLRKQAKVEPEMLRVLESPHVRALYEHPSEKMRAAHAQAVALSRVDAELKIGRGALNAEEAAARVDLHHRTVYGDQGAQHELGRFYVPDVAAHERLSNADLRKLGGGVGVPKKTGGMRHNKSVLFSTGRLALHGDLLGREYLSTVKYALHDDIHSELMASAVRVGRGRAREVPTDWAFLRRNAHEKIHPLARKAGATREQLHELAPDEELTFVTKDASDAATLHGDYLIVPKQLADELAGEYRKSNRAQELFLEKPTQVWRAIILGYRIGFLTNNVVGNHLMYAIKQGGYHGLVAYLNALKRAGKSPKLLRKLVGETKHDPAVYNKLMRDFFPDEVHETFGTTQKTNLVGERLQNRPRTKRAAEALEHGIVPATQAVAERFLRGAAVEAVLRGLPEVRAAYRQLKGEARTFEAAARKALDENPSLAREVSQKVNDSLGDYTSWPSDTQRALRAFFPFVAWYKAITKVALKLPLDNPVRTNALIKLGEIGDQLNQDQLGPLPDFLLNLLPLGGDKVVTTQGLNPYATEPQLAGGAKGALTARPGEIGRAASELGLNPIVQAAIEGMSGKEMFSGRDVKGGHGLPLFVASRVGGQLPQTQLVQALRGKQKPSKSFKPRDTRELLLQQLGIPVRTLNRGYVNQRAKR